ncbi:MAG: radical SAM family heme chaperone HemW [Pseudomonadota bacterium]
MDGGFGLYVHWPFCQTKCPYCDFNSHARRDGVDQTRYAAALVRELETMAAWFDYRTPLDTIFFGGGTPSLMEPGTVAAVLNAAERVFGFVPNIEISLEANPTSVEQSRFEGFRAAGVNRVSLGIQSLRDDALRRLGRMHDAAEGRAALALARSIFGQVSADMIYARPGQTLPEWRGELAEMLDICGDHLSLYQLTIEPETRYWKLAEAGKLTVPDDDTAADLYELTHDMTEAAGLMRYEVSNHAKPSAEAKHNLVYWRSDSWLGIGPGAHGRVSLADGTRMGTATTKAPEAWLNAVEANGHGLESRQTLGPQEAADEMLIMGLRLAEGLNAQRYRARTGLNLFAHPALPGLIDDGLVERSGDVIAVAEAGRLLTNAVVRMLSDDLVVEDAA